MRRQALCALLVIASGLSRSNAQNVSARDLTVRLFSTAPVQNIMIEPTRPESLMVRTCASCVSTRMDQVLHIRAADSDKRLSVDGHEVPEFELDGEARLTAEDGRKAAGAGRWKIRPTQDGLHVTLDVPSERYVMAVLQSEAGANDGPEALKALAVVARSYALAHPNRHGAEGLCDSTHCQALRMAAVPERIHNAVLDTAGETLWFGAARVDGYFTENCGGRTADASEVWGGPRKPWLVAHPDPYCQRKPAQWQARVTSAELTHALISEGFHPPASLQGILIASRDSSSRATKLEFRGSGQTVVVSASSLRFAVNRELGWNRIRSDWYSVHIDGSSVIFDGRGYGHGVGLCQAGAAEMAKEGKSYRQMLAFYFPGAQVRLNKSDDGWRTEKENGWSLRSTQVNTAIASAGDAAWAEAKSRWPEQASAQPVVTVSPDTELFRQLTNQPGWALASTSGQQVTLQPLSVVNAHTHVQTLLLHEFLHVLLESEASDAAPLWLREGLIEVLTHEDAFKARTTRVDQVEANLRNAKTLREAQQAHQDAAALVQKFVSKYGLASVRGWLRNGIPAGILAG